LRLPDSIHRHIKGIAHRQGISINQFISSAVAEKVSALMTEEVLEARVKKPKKGTLKRILDKIPAVRPFEATRRIRRPWVRDRCCTVRSSAFRRVGKSSGAAGSTSRRRRTSTAIRTV
jgi:hypothetical protein